MTLKLRSLRHLLLLAAATLPLFALASSAYAYKDGTYNCKHGDAKIPANVYKISTVDLVTAGGSLPFVDLVSYFREDSSDPNSAIHESHLKGFATVWSDNGDNDALLMASVRLDFNKGNLVNCAQ